VKEPLHTRDVGLAISLSNAISIETLLYFQTATAGDSNKHVMFSRLCKHLFREYYLSIKSVCQHSEMLMQPFYNLGASDIYFLRPNLAFAASWRCLFWE
jgi:hypothetical protein